MMATFVVLLCALCVGFSVGNAVDGKAMLAGLWAASAIINAFTAVREMRHE